MSEEELAARQEAIDLISDKWITRDELLALEGWVPLALIPEEMRSKILIHDGPDMLLVLPAQSQGRVDVWSRVSIQGGLEKDSWNPHVKFSPSEEYTEKVNAKLDQFAERKLNPPPEIPFVAFGNDEIAVAPPLDTTGITCPHCGEMHVPERSKAINSETGLADQPGDLWFYTCPKTESLYLCGIGGVEPKSTMGLLRK